MPGLCNYIMNQMDKQNRIDGLREAVESGDLERVRALLKAAFSEKADGVTALHVAAALGEVEAARMLLDAGDDVNAQDAAHGIALHYAVRRGQTAMVALLLERGSDDSLRKKWRTPMELAAKRGFVDIVRLLVEHGADGGPESLVIAARQKDRRIVECLVERGACVGEYEIRQAALGGSIPLVEYLVAHRQSGSGVPGTEEERLIVTVDYYLNDHLHAPYAWENIDAPYAWETLQYLSERGEAGSAALKHHHRALLQAALNESDARAIAMLIRDGAADEVELPFYKGVGDGICHSFIGALLLEAREGSFPRWDFRAWTEDKLHLLADMLRTLDVGIEGWQDFPHHEPPAKIKAELEQLLAEHPQTRRLHELIELLAGRVAAMSDAPREAQLAYCSEVYWLLDCIWLLGWNPRLMLVEALLQAQGVILRE